MRENIMEKYKIMLQTFWEKNKHFMLMFYFVIYLAWFIFLENHVTTHFHVIHMDIDDYIPFCEFFIVPYLLWFAYIAVVIVYMGFQDKKEYFHLCAFLFTGMTLFLIISTVFPNGHFLRPTEFERDNIFTQLCAMLYSSDTATNLFPSIHVYNSIGVHLAIANSGKTRRNRPVRLASGILMVSIILATVFLKQHSMFDVLTAFFTASVVYLFEYIRSWEKAKKTIRFALMYLRRQTLKLKRRFVD